MDFMAAQSAGRGTNVTINNPGDTPRPFLADEKKGVIAEPVFNDQGQLIDYRYRNAPGSPAASEIESEQSSAERRAQIQTRQDAEQGEVVLTAIDDAIAFMDEAGRTEGMIGGALAALPGANSNQLESKLSPIRAALAFDRLAQIKASSPNGGALGQVTERELQLLSDSAGALAPGLPDADRKKTLGSIKERYKSIMKRLAWSPGAELAMEWSEYQQYRKLGIEEASPPQLEAILKQVQADPNSMTEEEKRLAADRWDELYGGQ